MVGVQFLAITADMTELLLNAVALVFVLEIDEIIYACMVPRQAHTMLPNLQPVPMPAAITELKTFAGTHSCLKVGVLALLTAAVQWWYLDPFFGRIDLAVDILCSGNKDFVSN